MKQFIFFLLLNPSHIYIQSIGSKEKLYICSSSEISYEKKLKKNDFLSFFPLFVFRHNAKKR